MDMKQFGIILIFFALIINVSCKSKPSYNKEDVFSIENSRIPEIAKTEADSVRKNLKIAMYCCGDVECVYDKNGNYMTDVEFMNLKGKVKSYSVRAWRSNSVTTFDSLGFITSYEDKRDSTYKFYRNYQKFKNFIWCDVYNERDSFLYQRVIKYGGETITAFYKVSKNTIIKENVNRYQPDRTIVPKDSVILSIDFLGDTTVYKKVSDNNVVKFSSTKTAVPSCTKYIYPFSSDACVKYLMIDRKGQLVKTYEYCKGAISSLMDRFLYDDKGNLILRESRSDYFESDEYSYTYYDE